MTLGKGQHTAPDGRRFATVEQRSGWWAARCECGHWLTKYDFEQADAVTNALGALSRTDELNRRDFAHPKFQCRGGKAA